MSRKTDIADQIAEVKSAAAGSPLAVYHHFQVDVKRAGREICCPLHEETTPSFRIYRDGGFYCFGACKTGGDVIKFAQLVASLSFKEALAQCQFALGLEVRRPVRSSKPPRQWFLVNVRTGENLSFRDIWPWEQFGVSPPHCCYLSDDEESAAAAIEEMTEEMANETRRKYQAWKRTEEFGQLYADWYKSESGGGEWIPIPHERRSGEWVAVD